MSEQHRPLFAVLADNARPLATALTAQPTPAIASPWLPQSGAKAAADAADLAVRANELAAMRAAAIAEGRAEGLRETEALRATLTQLAGEVAAARERRLANITEAIAECAIAAIEGWIVTAPKQELFAPIVRAWLDRAGSVDAIARVHPGGVAALEAAIAETPIKVEADPSLAPGDLKIRGESLDTTHLWSERLRELRDAIATALEQEPA
jgi:flagellar biosynthesis/type III secretory pathway protein FliH